MGYRHTRTSRKAFTLVELLIVIIIIAVLAAIAIPKFSNSSTRSKEAALRSNLKLVRNAVELFRADTGLLPSALADLAATTAPANGLNSSAASTAITASDWRGPYLQEVPKDINGGNFTYVTTAGTTLGNVNSAATGYTTW